MNRLSRSQKALRSSGSDTTTLTPRRARLARRGMAVLAGAVVTTACLGSPTTASASTSNAETAFDYFVAKGLSSVQSAAIVGNLQQESGPSVDPTAVQNGGTGPGHGIAQWEAGGRWDTSPGDNVLGFAASAGRSSTALDLQLDFIWFELTAKGYGYSALRQDTTVSDAVTTFASSFEKCGTCDMSTRVSYANAVLSAYGSTPSAPAAVAQVWGDGNGWHNVGVGLSLPRNASFSTTYQGGAWPTTMANNNGHLVQIGADSTNGWRQLDTGVLMPATAQLTSADTGGTWPQVIEAENGHIMQITGSATAGWKKADTGLTYDAASSIGLSSTYISGSTPHVMANVGGTLFEIWGDSAGWHKVSTNLTLTVGSPQSTTYQGGAWPTTMANENGHLMQIVGTSTGWKKLDTGVRVGAGSISSVDMSGGTSSWPQVMDAENGHVYQIVGSSSSGWTKTDTGLTTTSTARLSTTNTGGTWPNTMALA